MYICVYIHICILHICVYDMEPWGKLSETCWAARFGLPDVLSARAADASLPSFVRTASGRGPNG